MPVYRLIDAPVFPPAEHADASGLLAVGGDLCEERLLLAYQQGIFPWYSPGESILWHSPDPRMVLWAPHLHVPRSLKKVIRGGRFEVRFDTAFDQVLRACARVPRPEQDGTWIGGEMIDAYARLHAAGFAHSVEAFRDGTLVGGLYGVCLGGAFFGESMFTTQADASKVAFVCLVLQLRCWGVSLVDCQVHTEHLERFGAELWPRSAFLAALKTSQTQPTRRGAWRFELSAAEVREELARPTPPAGHSP